MRVMGRRCCGNGSSEGGGGPDDFLAGGPKFEVTPLQMTIPQRRIVRFNLCLILGWAFRGRRIEWR